MGRTMGLAFGLEKKTTCVKRKFRWLLKIPEISASGVYALPPLKSARPNLQFKEMEVQHLNETVYFPSKPDWKPINLILFDLKRPSHPVFNWLKKCYDPELGTWKPVAGTQFKVMATLELYDGCGETMETWKLENAWPQMVDFGELDMGNSEFITADITLRYDRAYITDNNGL